MNLCWSNLWPPGATSSRRYDRALILLRADAGEIVEGVEVSAGAVSNVRRRSSSDGLDAALRVRPRTGAMPLLDGKAEAIVIATACSPVPHGRSTWTARMLANHLYELQIVEGVSEDTILLILKEVSSSPGR